MLVLLLFGRGRISGMMGDIGKGLKSFKQGMADEEDDQLRRYSEQRRDEGAPELPSEQAAPERNAPASRSPSPWGDDNATRP
jgi:sec-independent protein translocase protein TatA